MLERDAQRDPATERVADERRRQQLRHRLDERERLVRQRRLAEPGEVGRGDVVAAPAQELDLPRPEARVAERRVQQDDPLAVRH
jgi:hypothetical protein